MLPYWSRKATQGSDDEIWPYSRRFFKPQFFSAIIQPRYFINTRLSNHRQNHKCSLYLPNLMTNSYGNY